MYRIEFPSRQADRIRCSNTRWPSTRKGAAKKETKPKTPMIESIDESLIPRVSCSWSSREAQSVSSSGETNAQPGTIARTA